MIAALLDLSNPTGTCAINLANFNNPPQQPQSTTPTSSPILITAQLSGESGGTLTAQLGSCKIYGCTLDLTLNIVLQNMVSTQLTSSFAFQDLMFDASIDLTMETLLIDLKLQSRGGITLEAPFTKVQIAFDLRDCSASTLEKCEAEVGIAAVFAFNASPSGTPSTTAVSSLLPASPSTITGTQLPAPSKWECALVAGVDAETAVDIDLALLTVDQISLADICSFLQPGVPTDLGQALNGISLEQYSDLLVRRPPGRVSMGFNLTLPDGSSLPTGLIFQGGLTWGSFSAFAGITVDSNSCYGSLWISPFNIGKILIISGKALATLDVQSGRPLHQVRHG